MAKKWCDGIAMNFVWLLLLFISLAICSGVFIGIAVVFSKLILKVIG